VIPESFGGAGAGFVELAIVLIELGRALAPGPFLGSCVLGTAALLASGPSPHQERWLPQLARGEARASAAVTGRAGRPEELDLRARPEGAEWVIDGVAAFVPDAHVADVIVLAALDELARPVLLVVEPPEPGLTVEVSLTHDLTRRLCTITANGVRLPRAAELSRGFAAQQTVASVLSWGAAALACDSVGIAERVLDETVRYAGTRVQFDRPIGSFQAVKHRCTDMFIAVESARVLAEDAACAVAIEPARAPIAAAAAKAYATDAAATVAGHGVQLHGGLGYTWEHDMHLYLKRAKLNQSLLGTSRWHRRRLADAVLSPRRVNG
jgi:alkylation response protein AidB-like acyl-CoA dehydrogenase